MPDRYLLLVDDEPNILKALSRELEFWTEERNITILTAPHAIKALEILKEKGAETLLVVSDLRMPEMNTPISCRSSGIPIPIFLLSFLPVFLKPKKLSKRLEQAYSAIF
jgi:CheY-like chemotaxis protein